MSSRVATMPDASVGLRHDASAARATSGGTVLLRWAPLAAWIAACLCVALPILGHAFVPMVDLPAHMARQFVMSDSQGALDRFYEYRFSFVPNAAVDMLRALIPIGDIFAFTRAVTAAYAVLFVSSVMVLARVLWGRWVAWPAASALLVFNGVFFWGFQNFLVTVPVAVFGFALWIAIEARPAWQRALAFVPVAAVVMLMHLYAFLGLALMAGGYEIQRVIEAPRGERGAQMRRCLILALPFVLMCGVELVDILTAPANPNGGKTSWGEVMMRFLLPVRMLASPFEIHWPRLWQSTVMVIVAFAAFLIATLNGLRPAARFGIRIDRRIAGPALALFVASLAVPYLLGGVYYSDMRFPIFFAMLLFAGSRWHGVGPGAGAVIATLIAAVVVMRSMAYDDLARHYDADLRDLGRIAGALPPGAKVLAVSDAVETSGDPMFWHLDAYLVPMAKVYVPSLFLGVHNFRVRSEWAEMSAPQTGLYYQKSLIAPGQTPSRFDETYVQDWDRKYDYVVMIGPGQEPLAAPDRLVPTAVSGRFSLYRVTP